MKPLITPLYGVSYAHAFAIQALVAALVTAITLSVHNAYRYHAHRHVYAAAVAAIATFVTWCALRLCFGMGASVLGQEPRAGETFWSPNP